MLIGIVTSQYCTFPTSTIKISNITQEHDHMTIEYAR